MKQTCELFPKTDVAGYTYKELVERAVRAAKFHPIALKKWAAVADVFAVGSKIAIAICKKFKIDPHANSESVCNNEEK